MASSRQLSGKLGSLSSPQDRKDKQDNKPQHKNSPIPNVPKRNALNNPNRRRRSKKSVEDAIIAPSVKVKHETAQAEHACVCGSVDYPRPLGISDVWGKPIAREDDTGAEEDCCDAGVAESSSQE